MLCSSLRSVLLACLFSALVVTSPWATPLDDDQISLDALTSGETLTAVERHYEHHGIHLRPVDPSSTHSRASRWLPGI